MQKSKKEATKKTGNGHAFKPEVETKIDDRKHLLARVAGNVAIGIIGSPSDSTGTAAGIAEISVDIAEEILKKSGL
jgi:hypothetical protein